jgi:hypothetical protein
MGGWDTYAPQVVNVEGAERNWAGTYLVSASRSMPDVRDPSGRKWVVSSPTPLIEGERIAARLGVRFGIGFTVRGTPVGQLVQIRRVWRFPPMTNPMTGVTLTRAANEIVCRLGESCFIGQFLAQDFEVIPGVWTVDVWFGDTKLLEQSFTLFQPNE